MESRGIRSSPDNPIRSRTRQAIWNSPRRDAAVDRASQRNCVAFKGRAGVGGALPQGSPVELPAAAPDRRSFATDERVTRRRIAAREPNATVRGGPAEGPNRLGAVNR